MKAAPSPTPPSKPCYWFSPLTLPLSLALSLSLSLSLTVYPHAGSTFCGDGHDVDHGGMGDGGDDPPPEDPQEVAGRDR